jgi:hypothetical protein
MGYYTMQPNQNVQPPKAEPNQRYAKRASILVFAWLMEKYMVGLHVVIFNRTMHF